MSPQPHASAISRAHRAPDRAPEQAADRPGANRAPASLAELLAPLAGDLEAVEAIFERELVSDLDCVGALVRHVSRFRGKMLRPMLLLLAARAVRPNEPVGEEVSGIPLGVDSDFEYESKTIPLGRGEFLATFTDGFSEALNASNELYGLERLRKRIGHAVKDVADLGHVILDDVKSFVGGHPQSDDMCLVCFGRA